MNKSGSTQTVYLFEHFRLDRQARQLMRLGANGGSVPVLLGARALDILIVLVERSGQIVSKTQLMDAVWPGLAVEESNLTVQIAALRRVVDHGWHGPSLIQTVHARGYLLTAVTTRMVAPIPEAAPFGTAFKEEVLAGAQAQSERLLSPGSLPSPAIPTPGVMETTNLSVIVLPFDNFSGGPAESYLANSIMEDLTTGLARASNVSVIGRHTALAYRGNSVDVKRLGRELGVRYVVQGSVRRIGDQVRLSIQLINTESGSHAWADQFDTDCIDAVEISDEITGRLVRTLLLAIRAASYQDIENKDLTGMGVQELVNNGFTTIRFISREYLQTPLRYFERALTLDPECTDAQVGTASVLLLAVTERWATNVEQDLQRAEQLLVDAFAHGANDARAHSAMAALRRLQNRFPEALIEAEAAIALNPSSPLALSQLGIVLLFTGQPEAAILRLEKAVRLNPRDPTSHIAYSLLGLCRLLLGDPDAAIGDLRRACAAIPGHFYAYLFLAAALGLKEEIGPAKAALAEAVRIEPRLAEWLRAGAVSPKDRRYKELADATLLVGLRRAGMPEV